VNTKVIAFGFSGSGTWRAAPETAVVLLAEAVRLVEFFAALHGAYLAVESLGRISMTPPPLIVESAIPSASLPPIAILDYADGIIAPVHSPTLSNVGQNNHQVPPPVPAFMTLLRPSAAFVTSVGPWDCGRTIRKIRMAYAKMMTAFVIPPPVPRRARRSANQ
jgi:hypothetical protein